MTTSMKRISEKLTWWLQQNGTIGEEDIELYTYGINQLLMDLIDTISILILALVFGEIAGAIAFLSSFCAMRRYCGGFHANTPCRCYLITIGTACLTLWLLHIVELPITMMLGVVVLCGLFIGKMAPVQTPNKVLDRNECVVYRRRAVIMWALTGCLMVMFWFLGLKKPAMGIMLSNVLCVMTMIAGMFILRKRQTVKKEA